MWKNRFWQKITSKNCITGRSCIILVKLLYFWIITTWSKILTMITLTVVPSFLLLRLWIWQYYFHKMYNSLVVLYRKFYVIIFSLIVGNGVFESCKINEDRPNMVLWSTHEPILPSHSVSHSFFLVFNPIKHRKVTNIYHTNEI